MKPNCYNRPPYKETRIVQDGWTSPIGNMTAIVSPKMVEIADPMSKGCQQHGPLGEATLHPERWDCAGCRWKPD